MEDTGSHLVLYAGEGFAGKRVQFHYLVVDELVVGKSILDIKIDHISKCIYYIYTIQRLYTYVYIYIRAALTLHSLAL